MNGLLEYIDLRNLEREQDTLWRLSRSAFNRDPDYSPLALLGAAADLPRKFGLGASKPVWLMHSGFVPNLSAEAKRNLVKRAAAVPETAHGWTDLRAPDQPHLMLTEICKGCKFSRCTGFHFRSGIDVFRVMIHEFGHRLEAEFPDIVPWGWRPEFDQCKEGVREFEAHVFARSAPGFIGLGDYDQLAAKCQRARGYHG